MTKEKRERMKRIDQAVRAAKKKIGPVEPAIVRDLRNVLRECAQEYDQRCSQTSSLSDLLLRVHNDKNLAKFLGSIWNHAGLQHGDFEERYDYDMLYYPKDYDIHDQKWFLRWKPRNSKIDFDYAQICLASTSFAYNLVNIPFVLKNERFALGDYYDDGSTVPAGARGREISDLFPELTAEELEKGVVCAIKRAEEYALKNIKSA